MKTIFYPLFALTLLMGLLFSPLSAREVSAASCGDTYTVKSGDYLTKIAQTCGVTYDSLLKANPEITNPNLVYVGQVIRVKPGVTVPETPPSGEEYVVVSGDTISKIAFKYGMTATELMKLNPEIKNASLIYVGQVIRVKGSAVGNSFITISSASLKPGDTLEVKVKGFPAKADVDFRLGVDGKTYTKAVDGVTDANGEATVKIEIPSAAKAGEKWSVAVLTTSLVNGKEARSPLITIR